MKEVFKIFKDEEGKLQKNNIVGMKTSLWPKRKGKLKVKPWNNQKC